MANAATSENNNSVGGKKLTELKVVELRSELEKRGLDKTGVKAVLLERLVKALEGEGQVPEDYLFVESELKSKKSSGRLSRGATEEKEIKEEEDDETEDEEGSMITTDEYCQPSDSNNLSNNLEGENSDKVVDVDESTDVDEPVAEAAEEDGPAATEEDEPSVTNEEPTVTNDDEPMVDNVDEPTIDNADEVDMITNEILAPPTEKQIPEEDANKNTSQVETNDISSDPAALPPQSSSSSSTEVEDAKAKEKEEDEEKQQNGAEDKSTTAGTEEERSAAPASTNDVENENMNAVNDLILPPTPTSVPCMAPLTLKDTIEMDTSTAQQNEENESLIVHVDDTQNDLDADLLTSQANGLKLKLAAKGEKAIGKSAEGKSSDVGGGSNSSASSNPPEVGGGSVGGGAAVKIEEVGDEDKGGNAEVKTEKKADEKKDDKDGKLKSSPSSSKLKVIKNLKGGNQNSRNLWISGLSTTTQATDLKGHFSKYGKVVGAKVVTNTRSPGAKCFGFLTMSSAEEASKCIEHLNQTELHGKMISVERAKNEPGTQAAKKTETKLGDKKADKPEIKKEGGGQNSRNLWISGLSSNTRATDLKGLFSKYGKVVGAKVVTNARSPGARCYGFLTMSSSEEASKCIQHLNQTELHGKMISVERAKNEPGTQAAKKPETKPSDKKTDKPEVKKEEKKEGEKKDIVKKEEKKEIKKEEKDRKPVIKKEDKLHRSSSSHRKISDKSRVVVMDKSKGEPVISVKRGSKESSDKTKSTPPSKDKISTTPKSKSKEPSESGKDKSKKDVLSFDQIRAERERERLRQSERRLREEERRRIRELDRARLIQRDVQRRQKEEALRLERVRERLRMEREKLEREKMERERIKLEREILERERFREEQRRAELLRIEEQQRRALKRSYERSNTHEESGFWNEPKRPSLSTPSTRFDHSFSNESRYNEFENRDYERRVERYERREGRSVDSSAARFDERKERDLARRDIGPVRDIRDRDDRRPDERSRPDDRFERREVGPSRDRSNDRSHDTDRRDLGQDRGRDSDRRSISAHDRLGRVRNSPAVPPDQRTAWGSGLERKVDNWSHTHSNLDNGGVTRQNDRWMSNNIAASHDRGTTSGGGGSTGSGGFGGGSGGPGASGMVQNMGPGNMYVSPQSQPATMMVGGGGGGGGNMGSRMQEPRFDAYKHMRRY